MTRKARRVWALSLSRCYGPNFLVPEKQPKLVPVFKHHPAFCPVLRRLFLEHASLEPPLFLREVHLELPPAFHMSKHGHAPVRICGDMGAMPFRGALQKPVRAPLLGWHKRGHKTESARHPPVGKCIPVAMMPCSLWVWLWVLRAMCLGGLWPVSQPGG